MQRMAKKLVTAKPRMIGKTVPAYDNPMITATVMPNRVFIVAVIVTARPAPLPIGSNAMALKFPNVRPDRNKDTQQKDIQALKETDCATKYQPTKAVAPRH